MTEFRGAGTGAGYRTWPVAVMAGHELTLEASPLDAGTYVQLYINNGTGRGLDSLFAGNSLGTAQSNRTDVSARLNVFCCSP